MFDINNLDIDLESSDIYQILPHTLAVGWSGGLDSTALLLLLKQQGFNIQAWHIDHAWHEQSAQDSIVLEQRAKEWGIPFFSKRLPYQHQRNREAEARKGRYAAFQDLAATTGIQHLALAHHADDQVETVCMRMLQGSGVMGLRGIQAHMSVQSLHIYRPLLHVRKHAIQQCLQINHIPWLEDCSNTDVSLWRNKIRHHLLPAIQANGVDPYDLWMRWQQQAVRLADDIE
ncbi:MAG: tRNA lysidine(34) synthetase TilS, partial [Mariprofundaceae bacterium]|nr:tRNA lysidine(34) synthetase TilS [Mariprofundaceae bacterium]